MSNINLSIEMEESELQKSAGKIIVNSIINNVFETYIEPEESEYKINIKRGNKFQFLVSIPKEEGKLIIAVLKNMAELDIGDKKTKQEGFILRDYKGKEINIKCTTNSIEDGEMLVLTNLNQEVT